MLFLGSVRNVYKAEELASVVWSMRSAPPAGHRAHSQQQEAGNSSHVFLFVPELKSMASGDVIDRKVNVVKGTIIGFIKA